MLACTYTRAYICTHAHTCSTHKQIGFVCLLFCIRVVRPCRRAQGGSQIRLSGPGRLVSHDPPMMPSAMEDGRAAVELLMRKHIAVPGVDSFFRTVWRFADLCGIASETTARTAAPRLEFPARGKVRLDWMEFDVGIFVTACTRVPTVVAHSELISKYFDMPSGDIILQDVFSLSTKLYVPKKYFPEFREQLRSQMMQAVKCILLHGCQQSTILTRMDCKDGNMYTAATTGSLMILDGSVYILNWQLRYAGAANPTMESAVMHLCRQFRDSTRVRAHVRQLLSRTYNLVAPRRTSFLRPLGYVAKRFREREPFPSGLSFTVMDFHGGFVTLTIQSDDPDCDTRSCPGDISENRVFELDELIELKESGNVSLLMSQLHRNSECPSLRSRGSLGHPHTCKPCPFFCFKKGNGCFFGAMCNGCHGPHLRRKPKRVWNSGKKMVADDQNRLMEGRQRLSGDASAIDEA